MSIESPSTLIVRKSITVACLPEQAFRIFTEGIATWWPLETHSLGEEQATTCVLEPRVGGRLYERWHDGTERPWGSVVAYDPPHRLAVSWQVNPDAAGPTEWEVSFVADEDGTRLELEHRGWEVLGEAAAGARQNYDGGWDVVLGRFAATAA